VECRCAGGNEVQRGHLDTGVHPDVRALALPYSVWHDDDDVYGMLVLARKKNLYESIRVACAWKRRPGQNLFLVLTGFQVPQ
jgi:hypothetical protein